MSSYSDGWKPVFLLIVREIIWYVPKASEALPELPGSPADLTEFYRSSGMPDEVVSVRVLFEYQRIATVLKDWKYGRDAESERRISEAYANAVEGLPDFPEGASVMYVPIGIDRRYARGFNQSERLAKIVGKTHRSPVFRWVFRFWSGDHQSNLSKTERLSRNFEFWMPPFVGMPERVILVDDVISTGATLRAYSEFLIRKGCKNISILALARSSQ